jgi:hypothetical protein
MFFQPAGILVKLPEIPAVYTVFGPFPGLSSYSGRNSTIKRQ